MKIVIASNFDKEMYEEQFLNLPHLTELKAERIIRLLNELCSGPSAEDYYKIVPDDYKLYKFKS